MPSKYKFCPMGRYRKPASSGNLKAESGGFTQSTVGRSVAVMVRCRGWGAGENGGGRGSFGKLRAGALGPEPQAEPKACD